MINVSDTYEYTTVFTQHDVKAFAELTGDNNPIHIDKAFAEKSEFGRQVVQGVLIQCAFSKVFGTMWPKDDNSFFISQDVQYIRPVYPDVCYTIKFECTSIDHQRAIGTIVGIMKSPDGIDVMKMTARISSKKQFSAPIV